MGGHNVQQIIVVRAILPSFLIMIIYHPLPLTSLLYLQIVLMFRKEWSGCDEFLRASTRAVAAACASDAAGRCDLTEALFIALQAITKKKPEYLDALEELLPHLVELGKRNGWIYDEFLRATDAIGRCDLTKVLFIALQAITITKPEYLEYFVRL